MNRMKKFLICLALVPVIYIIIAVIAVILPLIPLIALIRPDLVTITDREDGYE